MDTDGCPDPDRIHDLIGSSGFTIHDETSPMLPWPTEQILNWKVGIPTEATKDHIDGMGTGIARSSLDAALKPVQQVVAQQYEELFHTAERRHRGLFGVIYTLSESEWADIFSETPQGLDSWDPIWKGLQTSARSTVETAVQDDALSQDRGFLLRRQFRKGENKVLPVDISYGQELVELGFLTKDQSQAHQLSQVGYDVADIASLMDISMDQVSARLTEARREMRKLSVGNRLRSEITIHCLNETTRPERVGNTYITEQGVTASIVGHGYNDAREQEYLVRFGGNRLETVPIDAVREWKIESVGQCLSDLGK